SIDGLRDSVLAAALAAACAAPAGAGDFAVELPAGLRAGAAGLSGKAPAAAAAALPVFDPGVSPAVKEQMARDLDFVSSIRAAEASRLHREVFGPVAGPAYVRWFASRVKAVGFDAGDDGPTTIAYVLTRKQPWKMWVTRNFVGYAMPQIARVMFMFHEARHTETDRGNWHHAVCPDPFRDEGGREVRGILSGMPMAGKAVCDRVALGSYGSSVVMLKNISKFCSNCAGKARFDAGLYADDQLKRIIDDSARREIKDDLYR
ncbi:MAG: hypothetical protein PHF00_01865, partial [Elusimicrobia bacterium]|nr:hypothetical protein [Elusimicrobiota bacterium]